LHKRWSRKQFNRLVYRTPYRFLCIVFSTRAYKSQVQVSIHDGTGLCSPEGDLRVTHVKSRTRYASLHRNPPELYLSKVEVSCSKLDGLVRTNLTKLGSVQLWCVELTAGRWADVLAKFCELQNLITLGINSYGYSLLGSVSHRAQRLLPESDNL